MRPGLDPEEFERLVQDALATLPRRYRRRLQNVAVIVEDEPPSDVLEELGLQTEDDLLGLYSGTPIGQESFFDVGAQLPARISIYRGPILRLCHTRAEAVEQIRETIMHEIGHHLGLADEDMPY